MSQLIKKKHWEAECFDPFLLARKTEPFAWGSNDCALFAADAILANTGTDIAAEFRDKYTTHLGAFKTIREVTGGSSVVDAVTYCAEKFGLVEYTYPLMAKVGDLVLVENGDDIIAGVIHLNGIHVVSVAETGLVRLPILNAAGKPTVVRAWSV